MSDQRYRTTWPFVILMLLLGTAAWTQEVRFISPQNGATIRGVVNLQATKTNPDDGWMSYKIGAVGKEAVYVAAVIKPFSFYWDTRARGKDGTRLYPDGDYVLTASAFDPSGNAVGESSVTVTLANDIGPAEIGSTELRCRYQKAEKLTFSAEGNINVSLPKEEKERLYIPLNMDVLVKADWEEVVLSPTSDASAVLDKIAKHAFVQVVGSEGFNLPAAGKKFRVRVSPRGFVDVFKEKDEHFPLGEYFVMLPDRPVKQGDTWEDDLAVLPLPNATERRIVKARMVLDGFEYVADRRCARILTKFSEKDRAIMVRVGSSMFPFKTSYEADRISYFGIDVGHFVAFEERMKHTLDLPAQIVQMLYQFQLGPRAQAMGGLAGMGGMGMPGMAMPGVGGMPSMGGMGPMGPAGPVGPMGPEAGMMMQPGMGGMPGMEPSMQGYGPGMMGGIPGSEGMMGGVAAQPAKVNIESTLKIIETTPVKS